MKISAVLYAAAIVSILTSLLAGKRDAGRPGERTVVLLGLWAPTLAVFGKVFEDREVRGEENPLHL